jgi:hypothetical protein
MPGITNWDTIKVINCGHKKGDKKMTKTEIVPIEVIENKIYLIRGQKVMFDRDLAMLYGVETRILNKAVKRNIDRFPSDFMFELNNEEYKNLKFHFGTSSWGGLRKHPKVFTEHGILMLSSVLNSKRAIHVNIRQIFSAIKQLMKPPVKRSKRIGFRV